MQVRDFSLENTTLDNKRIAAEEAPKLEDSAARAKRLKDQLRFRMKEAMAQRGGSEAFLHWLRSGDGKHA
jgi:hypothetical protein